MATTTEITKRNTLARIQKILNEYCSDEYNAEAAYCSLNDILKFDEMICLCAEKSKDMQYQENYNSLKEKAFEMLSEYVGKNLREAANHLKEDSFYNHNYYVFPNGLKVFEEFDEYYENGDIFAIMEDIKILIGHTDFDGTIHNWIAS